MGSKKNIVNWKAEVNSNSSWVFIGVCLKDIVKENNNKFTNLDNEYSKRSLFGISSNGYIWNRNNEKQNNRYNKNLVFSNEQIIYFSYNIEDISLSIKINENEVLLDGVFAENYMKLVPCVVFLKNGDSAKFYI